MTHAIMKLLLVVLTIIGSSQDFFTNSCIVNCYCIFALQGSLNSTEISNVD